MPADKSKSTKPLMEKRRRARINDSLMEIKTLVLDALNKNNPRHSKLEKADILEMTVRYLKTVQRQQISASVNSDPAKLGKYRSGYAECVNEVNRYLGATATTPEAAPELRTQLVGHLANGLCQQTSSPTTSSLSPHHQRQQSQAVPYPYAAPIRHQQHAEPSYATTPRDTVRGNAMSPSVDHTATLPARYNSVSPVPEGARSDFALTTPVYRNAPHSPNNSSRVVVSPPLDVAGSLPSGEITLVLPQQSLPNGQLPTHFIPVYAPQMPSPRSASPASTTGSSYSPVNSPVSFTSSPVLTTSHMQYQQTELSPVTREYFTYPQSEMVNTSAHVPSHYASKKESMWRPW